MGTAVCSSSGLERMDSSLSSLGGTFWSMDIFSAIPPCRQGASEDGQRARGACCECSVASVGAARWASCGGLQGNMAANGTSQRENVGIAEQVGSSFVLSTVCAGQSGGAGGERAECQ